MKKVIIFLVLVFAFGAGCISPMICRYWSWEKNDWKVVICPKSEDKGVIYNGEDTSTPEIIYPTSTEYVQPTYIIPTEIPTVQETLTVPYPPIEATWTPNPYPSTNWLDWWRR